MVVAMVAVPAGAFVLLTVENGVPWGLVVVWLIRIPLNARPGNGPRRAIRLNGERSTN
jgi:hypothetical protein